MNQSLLDRTISAITPVDEDARARAEQRQDSLTKPPRSLGYLETLGNQLSAISGQCPPPLPSNAVLGVFAGDHGIYHHKVSPWPQEVTIQMIANIAAGGASVNALAAETGTEVWAIDVGLVTPCDAPGITSRRVRAGSRDFTVERALTADEATAALEIGIELATKAITDGAGALVPGEVGIGNTTSAAAIIAAATESDAREATGSGAGAQGEMLERKIDVVRQGLELHAPRPDDGLDILTALGGLDIAGMAGFILGGAAGKVPVVIDGVISSAAALIACALAPNTAGYLFIGHAGNEPGITLAGDKLGARPVLDLGMRLGEGSGALAALPIIRCAARILRDMSTFAEAGVTDEAEY